MSWREFWHWLTTTRYTRRLELEIQQLKADNEQLRNDKDALLKVLYPAIRAARNEKPVRDEARKLPASFKL